jgi:hypothetical protein
MYCLLLCFCIVFVLCVCVMFVTCLLYCCTTATGLKPNCSLTYIYKLGVGQIPGFPSYGTHGKNAKILNVKINSV